MSWDVVVVLGLTSSEKSWFFDVSTTQTWFGCWAWWSEVITAVTQLLVS